MCIFILYTSNLKWGIIIPGRKREQSYFKESSEKAKKRDKNSAKEYEEAVRLRKHEKAKGEHERA